MDIGRIHLIPVQLDGQNDILPHAEHRNQVVRLEHKSDFSPAENRQCFILQRKNILAVYHDAAGSGPVQTAQHMQQGGFPGAGGSHNGHKLPLLHAQIHPIQGFHLGIPGAVIFFQVLGL